MCKKCGKETGAEWKTLCLACWRNRTPEEIRAYRQQKLDRKLSRMRSKADRLDRIGNEKTTELRSYEGDIAFFTQPNINNSKGRSFKRYRERIFNRYDTGVKMQLEAEDIRKTAEYMQRAGVRVKGDADKKRQEEREAADKLFTVGSRVYDWCFGDGVIMRVNKKSYTIKFDSGSTFARDKSYIKV